MRTAYLRAAFAAASVVTCAGCTSEPHTTPVAKNNSPSLATVQGAAPAPVSAAARRAGIRSPDGPRGRGASPAARRHGRLKGRGATPSGNGEAPQVLFNGVPAIAAPKVVPVIFPGNAFDAQVRAFFASLPTSPWWAETTAEYGVGPITLLPAYVPTDPAPTLDTVDQWIADLAASAPPGLPAPDDNTIYAVVLPQGWQQAEGACVTFGAYHETSTSASGQSVIHTVNPTCTIPYLGLVGIDDLTDSLSHEIEESATDATSTSYFGTNWAGSGWAAAAEGSPSAETADMCEFQPDSTLPDPSSGFIVQRIWSNVAAAAGHDPCKPLLPGEGPYFDAQPLPPDGTQGENFGYSRGVSLQPGAEVTIPVALRSDAPVGEWQLSAEEMPNPHLLPDVYNELTFSWDRTSGKAGDVRYLTIKRALPPDGGTPVFLRVAIQSTLGSVVHTNWLVVGSDDTVPGDTNLALDWL